MSILPSARFGGWTKKCNGVDQHGMSKKDLVNHWLAESGKIKKGMTKKQRRKVKRLLQQRVDQLEQAEVWYSSDDRYKVVKQTLEVGDGLCHNEMFSGTIWLSIRIDNGATHLTDWRDFQAIKNDLCGAHLQAVEIYPPEEMLHDTANVFHLWVFPPTMRLPLGWHERDVDYTASIEQRGE